jgi:carbon monoxide dehydrogenase subunit G
VKHYSSAASAIAAYLSLLGLVAAVDAADELPHQITVTVVRDGGVFEIDAQSRIVADREVAWAVLTDYEGYAEFVPGMISSRRLSEQPLRIEQHGEFGILFLIKHVYSTLDVNEDPPSAVRFHAIGGNLRRLETQVSIFQDGDTIVLTYRSTIEPDFWVPPLIGTSIVRAGIRRKLISVSNEIERRAAQEKFQ